MSGELGQEQGSSSQSLSSSSLWLGDLAMASGCPQPWGTLSRASPKVLVVDMPHSPFSGRGLKAGPPWRSLGQAGIPSWGGCQCRLSPLPAPTLPTGPLCPPAPDRCGLQGHGHLHRVLYHSAGLRQLPPLPVAQPALPAQGRTPAQPRFFSVFKGHSPALPTWRPGLWHPLPLTFPLPPSWRVRPIQRRRPVRTPMHWTPRAPWR